ncbi:hypothetical protein A1O3_02811 [Capronia epimyces CBS 606.96]|uniref:Oxidoreductase n=1 Tax=Capronia epimyces CBS 606.96 TaxID=1182542 RepID=W9Z5G1_9EURO|nr:uncharacterized protein A1O3_02811 [Capronia epimyces CBS 606.96]EXJ89744.1 hypothetical protein A1O3_02811 [Capronia epimyces CBS 606.96]
MSRNMLIAGYSDRGTAAVLAVAFHSHGDCLLVSARNPSKTASLNVLGIETLPLDVQSEESVKACIQQVSALTGGSLDVLVNNAGTAYYMPVFDSAISEMEKLFDLNVLSMVHKMKHLFAILRNSKHGGHLGSNTSMAGSFSMPWQGIWRGTSAFKLCTGRHHIIAWDACELHDIRVGYCGGRSQSGVEEQ